MRASALILAGSCLLASVMATPTANGPAAKGLVARVADDGHHATDWQHHDGDTDCDTDDDGWNTEEDREIEGWHKHHHDSDDDTDDSDSDDDSNDEHHHYPHYPHPEHPPTIPAPPPACEPVQSIQNPGFEANGGGLAPWRPSNPSTVLIDSQHGEPDAHGAHSARMLLNTVETAASISQHIKVCPHTVYRFYLAIKIAALNTAASTQSSNGGLQDNAQCTVFLGLEDAGNATITGASLTPGAYTAFHTANTFSTDEHEDSKVWVAISCAPSAFNTSQPSASFYIDNVQLLPEPRH